ncbi:interactor of constitutive active ROPs 4-like [Gossypium hirsutum]|uniref:Interactor of constitutive active ROPs 4-like n=1 Tax=Gossypium hirsutum TaxID=3635 RepID=A0A1U8IJ96_GOSHI|nr:interactor of constitutive active ROPs 4-like [Gossypium hirsutum]
MEEYLQVIPSELKIIKQDFEKINSELGKKIEQLEEEKIHLRLDVNVQKLETEKLRKGKRKVEEDLDSLKTNYKKLRMSMRIAGLEKTSEQWRQEVQGEKSRADQWEKRFHDARARENALKKSLVEGQDEREMLVARVAKLEKALHQHRSRNSDIELRASLSRIEDLKRKLEELDSALQNYELRIKFLESNNEQWKEQFRRS